MDEQLLGRMAAWSAAIVTVLLVAGVVFDALSSQPVSVDDALARFREVQASAASASPHAPDIPAPETDEVEPSAVADTGPAAAASPVARSSPAAAAPSRAGATAAPPRARVRPAPRPTAPSEAAPGAPAPAPEEATAAPTQTAAPRRPPAGVYTYATTGGEELHVSGGRRSYPAQTTITIVHGGCGLHTRWDALRERWDEHEMCTDAQASTVRSYTSYHEFFGQTDTEQFTCDQHAYALPPSHEPGASWPSRCASSDTVATSTTTVVGIEQMLVAGQPVETVHLRYETSVTGSSDGQRTSERWVRRSDGLLIRQESVTEATTQGPAGRLRYSERVELVLTALEPRR